MRRRFVELVILVSLLTSLSSFMQASSSVLRDRMIGPEAVYMSISLNMPRQDFTLRETVNLYGNLTVNGTLTHEGLVSIQVDDSNDNAVIFRTIPTGNFALDPLVNITEVVPCDASSPPTPATSLAIKTQSIMQVTVWNYDLQSKRVTVTVSIYDNSLIPIGASSQEVDVLPSSYATCYITVWIPEWACIGGATVVANAFTDYPAAGGVAYCYEKSNTFNITRPPGTTVFQGPSINIQSPPGTYNASFKLSPESRGGTYKVYTTAIQGGMTASQSTTFKVESNGVAPQASFAYAPSQPYVNQTVAFDGSASSAEGYADVIVRYEWNFGDGYTIVKSGNATNPPSPLATHAFTQVQTYIVTLNVTDTENLWCITSKPVTTLPPTGPTANFTWTRAGNLTMRYDASTSLPGWNGTAQSPIISYKWTFGDGNVTIIATPIITHRYAVANNYSVTLNVTDDQGLYNITTQIVTVSMTQYPPWDINQDGYTNAKDAVILGSHFSTQKGQPDYLEAADINADDYINAKDAVILGAHFGEQSI